MKNSLFRSILLLLMLMTIDATLVLAAPQLKVEPRKINLGDIAQGDVISQTLHLDNTGDTPLTIKQVKTSCGCTAAMTTKNLLAPGESGEINTTFNSSGFSGKIKKSIYIHSDDKTSPVTEVIMEGRVIPEIEISPEVIQLAPLKPGSEKDVPLAIVNHGKTPVLITGLQVLVPNVEANIAQQNILPGETFRFTIKVKPTTEIERLSGYLIVQTNRPNRSAIRIPFYAPIEE